MNPHRSWVTFALLSLLSGCSSNASPTDQGGAVVPSDLIDVIYVGGTSDEALLRLLDSAPKNDARHAVIVDSPDLNAPLPKDRPATLTFHSAGGTARAPAIRVRSAGPRTPVWQRSFHELLKLLSPERIAHAHGTPYNGTAYYLVFSSADSKRILQVFTPEKTPFTPEALDWQHLTEALQPLTLEITSATFEENNIAAGDGPFVGGKFSFRIE